MKLSIVACIMIVVLMGCAGLRPTERIYTVIKTEPPYASVEITIPGNPWESVGQSPVSVVFQAWEDYRKRAVIRVSKPGYYTEERIIPFSSITPETLIILRKVEDLK